MSGLGSVCLFAPLRNCYCHVLGRLVWCEKRVTVWGCLLWAALSSCSDGGPVLWRQCGRSLGIPTHIAEVLHPKSKMQKSVVSCLADAQDGCYLITSCIQLIVKTVWLLLFYGCVCVCLPVHLSVSVSVSVSKSVHVCVCVCVCVCAHAPLCTCVCLSVSSCLFSVCTILEAKW